MDFQPWLRHKEASARATHSLAVERFLESQTTFERAETIYCAATQLSDKQLAAQLFIISTELYNQSSILMEKAKSLEETYTQRISELGYIPT